MTAANEDWVNPEFKVKATHLASACRLVPSWAQERLLPWIDPAESGLAGFIEQSYWIDRGIVNARRIVGTQEQRYQSCSWLDLLNPSDPTATRVIDWCDTHPDTWLSAELAEQVFEFSNEPFATGEARIILKSLDGIDYYVGETGTLRATMARFAAHQNESPLLDGVSLFEDRVNHAMRALYHSLRTIAEERRLPVRLGHQQEPIGRDDGPGWTLDRYRVRITYQESAAHPVEHLGEIEAEAKLRELSGPSKRRWFRAWRDA